MSEIIMNPVRMRIIQYLAQNKTATTSQIKSSLTDISQATLYRQIAVLEKASLINVVSTNTIRGAIEKVYALNQNPPIDDSNGNKLINQTLIKIMHSFNSFFAEHQNKEDALKEMLCLTTSVLLLSDDEFAQMLSEIGGIVAKHVANLPNDERKQRRITFISSPN